MQYRKGYSMLGYGCMRFSTKNGSIIYEQARDQVMRGVEFSRPLKTCGLFPPMVVHMVAIG